MSERKSTAARKKKGMKLARRFGAVLIAVFVVVSVLQVTSYLFIPKNNDAASGMAKVEANAVMGEQKDSVDVLFVGDSEAYSSFSPLHMWEQQGFASYVCSTPGQTLPYGRTLLSRALRSQQPKVVVLETNSIYTPFTISDGVMRAAQDVFPVLEYHNRWKTIKENDLGAQVQTSWTDSLKGFKINQGARVADASGYMKPDDKTALPPPINRAYLGYMVQMCKSRGIKVVLVSTPSTVNWNMERHRGIADIARQMNVPYLDQNTEPNKVDIDWNTDTHDAGDHLNLHGARKVSTALGAWLKQTYSLPDRRDDPAYASWHELASHYNAAIAQGESS